MVGVAQDDTSVDVVAQLVLVDGFDAAHGAYGHEDGGRYVTVVRVEHARPGIALTVGGLE